MRKKRMFCLLCAVFMLLSLSACGQQPASPDLPEETALDDPTAPREPNVPGVAIYVPQENAEENAPEDAPVGAEIEAAPEETAAQNRLTQEDVDAALADTASRYRAAAIAVATIEHGTLGPCSAYGWAEKDVRELTVDTKFRVASISKLIVALCALRMSENGIVDLNAPLSAYWGEKAVNPAVQAQSTARSLLTHTSSLRDLETTQGLETLRILLENPASYRAVEPGNGDVWSYNNFGYCILGTTLELASGQLLDDYWQSCFASPLDLRSTFYSGKLEEEETVNIYNQAGENARSAALMANRKIPTAIGDGASTYPGAFMTSAPDLARVVCLLANDGVCSGIRYLSEDSVSQLETPLFTVYMGGGVRFGQCLTLRRQENLFGQSALCYHTGSAYGEYTLLSYNPETGNGVVVLTTGAAYQTEEHGIYAICADLSAALYAKMEDSQ